MRFEHVDLGLLLSGLPADGVADGHDDANGSRKGSLMWKPMRRRRDNANRWYRNFLCSAISSPSECRGRELEVGWAQDDGVTRHALALQGGWGSVRVRDLGLTYSTPVVPNLHITISPGFSI